MDCALEGGATAQGEEERADDADNLPDDKAEDESPTVRGHGASRNLSKAAHFSCRLFDAANLKAIDHKAAVNLRKSLRNELNRQTAAWRVEGWLHLCPSPRSPQRPA
jgi:hypothetical protein